MTPERQIIYIPVLPKRRFGHFGGLLVTMTWQNMTMGSVWVCSLNAVPAVGPWPWADTLQLRALQRFPEASLSPLSSPGLRRAERLWAAAVAPVRRAAACCNMGQVNNNNNININNSPRCCTHLHRRCRTPVAGGPGRSCTPPRAPPTATGPAARACKGCR